MTQFQTNPSNDPSRQDLPESMSLMGIGRADALTEAEQLELASEASGNSISQGTVLLIIIAIVAGGVLYGMRQLQGDISSGVDAKAVAKIDEALSKFAKPGAVASDDPLAPAAVQALFRDTDGIIAMLSSDFGRQQVPVEYVKKNPFALKLADKPVAMVASTGNPSAALKKLEQEINKYKLQTVMNGRVPIAVINGEMYRQGQQLGSFTIAEINSETLSVTLAGGGQQFNLAMEQQ